MEATNVVRVGFNMEIKKLPAIVLLIVLVGLIIGVGTLTLDKFGIAAKDSTTLLESVTFTAGAGSTANDDVTAVNYITNGTITAPSNNISFTSAGVITSGNSSIVGAYNVSYTYDKDSKATTTLSSSRDEVSNVSTVWLGLIITIVVLALILALVIRSFSFGAR